MFEWCSEFHIILCRQGNSDIPFLESKSKTCGNCCWRQKQDSLLFSSWKVSANLVSNKHDLCPFKAGHLSFQISVLARLFFIIICFLYYGRSFKSSCHIVQRVYWIMIKKEHIDLYDLRRFTCLEANIIWKQDCHDKKLLAHFGDCVWGTLYYAWFSGQRPIWQNEENNCACSNSLNFPIKTSHMDHIVKFSIGAQYQDTVSPGQQI